MAYFPTRSRMREYSSAPVPKACEGTYMHAWMFDRAECHTVRHRLDIYLPPLLKIVVQILNHKGSPRMGSTYDRT